MYTLTTEDTVSVLFRIDEARQIKYPYGGINKDIAVGTATMRLSSTSDTEIKVTFQSPLLKGRSPFQVDDDFVERDTIVRGLCVDHDKPYSRPEIVIEDVMIDVGDNKYLPLSIAEVSS